MSTVTQTDLRPNQKYRQGEKNNLQGIKSIYKYMLNKIVQCLLLFHKTLHNKRQLITSNLFSITNRIKVFNASQINKRIFFKCSLLMLVLTYHVQNVLSRFANFWESHEEMIILLIKFWL